MPYCYFYAKGVLPLHDRFLSPQIPHTSPHVLSQVNESGKKKKRKSNNHTSSFSCYVVLQWLLCLLLVEVCMMSFLVTHSEVLLNEVYQMLKELFRAKKNINLDVRTENSSLMKDLKP